MVDIMWKIYSIPILVHFSVRHETENNMRRALNNPINNIELILNNVLQRLNVKKL